MKNSNDNLNSKISDAADISKPWDKDNQAWWDWYVSLADNDVKEDEIINADPLPDIAIPSDDEVISELAEPYHLTNDQIDFFKKNGFIKLKKVFSPGAVLKLRAELINLLKEEFNEMSKLCENAFLILVCGNDGIASIKSTALKKVLDENLEPAEWISASRLKRESYAIKGSDGKLNFKINLKDFPRDIINCL